LLWNIQEHSSSRHSNNHNIHVKNTKTRTIKYVFFSDTAPSSMVAGQQSTPNSSVASFNMPLTSPSANKLATTQQQPQVMQQQRQWPRQQQQQLDAMQQQQQYMSQFTAQQNYIGQTGMAGNMPPNNYAYMTPTDYPPNLPPEIISQLKALGVDERYF
jgi:2-succinyl-5-enolpyruvyl-6-hydroxy-3-cyclohexene-1-carboxylate synthase